MINKRKILLKHDMEPNFGPVFNSYNPHFSSHPLKRRREEEEKTNDLQLPVGPDFNIEVYPMNHPRRGKAIIFNLYKFLGENEVRKGSEKDVGKLVEVFTSLGFEIVLQTDKTADEILSKLRDVSNEDHSDADCLVVVLMSHRNKVYCGEGKIEKVYEIDQQSSLEAYEKELFKPFEGDKCPSLLGKPKIFFIQVCRGDDFKTKKTFSKYEAYLSDRVSDKMQDDPLLHYIPNAADFLIVRVTVDGTYSKRFRKTGSPFIEILCEELGNNRALGGNSLDLESLILNVKRNSVKRQICQMPSVFSTLLRKVFLKPK